MERQQIILKAVVERYIPAAEPVASGQLADMFEHLWSSATIRNEMMELEEAGYLAKPHTSAGRIPTEKAYTTYVSELMDAFEPAAAERQRLGDLLQKDDVQEFIATLARSCQRAIVASQADHRVFAGGLAHIYRELAALAPDEAQGIAEAYDSLMDELDEVADLSTGEVTTLIGSRNPLHHGSTLVITRYTNNDEGPGVIALISPMRMDYRLCTGYLRLAQQLFSEL